MYYKQFIKSVSRPNVVETTRSYGNIINVLVNGKIVVNSNDTEFKSLEEARNYIKTKKTLENIEQEVTDEIYESISENKIAKIIREHHDIKVTDTIIESYIELASSNIFNVDPVVYEIRKLNAVDRIIENRIHYKLNDNSMVVIKESTQARLNNLLGNQKEIVEYMRESKENFLNVIQQLEEEHGVN